MTRPDPIAESLARERDRITIDDLRHKALAVRDVAKEEALAIVDQPTSRYVIAGAVIFAVAVSVAYFMGTRAAKAARKGEPPASPPPTVNHFSVF